MFNQYKVKPGSNVELARISPDYLGKKGKGELKDDMKDNVGDIDDLQERLFAEGKQSLLVVIQAMDTAGKDGVIRHVFRGVNPAGVRVVSFKVPTKPELAHDFLWRVHKETPEKGMITLFNRSHYEDVLVVKVHDWITADECKYRFGLINDFERLISHCGTKIIKLYLHITKDAQKHRLEERIHTPSKNWKFNPGDLPERDLWDAYMKCYEDAISATSTEYAPWFIIPSNNEKYRNYVASQIIEDTLREMDPRFPPAPEGIEKYVIK